MKVKECIICGNAFIPANNRQITCSQPCSTVNANNQRNLRLKKRSENKQTGKHCSRCGNSFTPENNQRSICDSCKTKAPVTRPCIECGKEFTTKGNSGQLICSDACRQARKSRYKATVYAKAPKRKEPVTSKCIICNANFTTTDPRVKFCSDKCRHTMKLNMQHEYRLNLRKRETPPVICTCKVCNVIFKNPRKSQFCSDECRARLKREKANIYNHSRVSQRTYCEKPVKQFAEKPEKQRVLTPQKPKADAVAVDAMIELNRNAPLHDRESLKKKNIVSPDISKMEFRHYDPRMRITRFFRSEEKYNQYLNEQKLQAS